MCSECTEGEYGGGTVGYYAVKVSSHGKTRDQNNSLNDYSNIWISASWGFS